MQYYQVSGAVLGMEKSKIIRSGSNYSQPKVGDTDIKIVKRCGDAVEEIFTGYCENTRKEEVA